MTSSPRACIPLLLLLAACTALESRPDTVDDVLAGFGVDLTPTPRLDDDLAPLPDGFAPLGGRSTINRFDELVLFGIRLADPAATTIGAMPVVDLVPDADHQLTAAVLADPAPSATPWLAGSIPRAAARGDFDRDGIDELAVVYQEPGAPVSLVVIDDVAGAGATSAPVVIGVEPGAELFAVAADFDGDLVTDLMIAQVTPSAVALRLVRNTGGGWAPAGQALTIPVLATGTVDVGVVLAAGNLDRDPGAELAVVVNERTATAATARHAIYDDAGTGFAALRSGPINVTTATAAVTVRAGGVALGDVDGDGVDEVVIGGLTAVGNTCNLVTSHAIAVLDDARHGLAQLAATDVPWFDTRQPCSSGASHWMETVHVLAPDLDGDGAHEIVTNELVHDDLRATGGALVELYRIPQSEVLTAGTSGSDYRFSWRTTAFAAADVSSDRRDDLVFYTQRDGIQVVQVWADDPIAGFTKRGELRTAFANGIDAGVRPQILLADVELDLGSLALEYSAGSHRLVFTEPVLIAALAAAPCSAALGQDLGGSCRTAFGKAVSETTARTDGWSFIAGVSVGFEAEVSVLGVKVGGVEAIINTRSAARQYTSSAYTVTTTVTRETGPIEDSVIFTTIPLDLYTYTILAHPNPELVGGRIELRLPRAPITILAEREFYNAHVTEDAFQVGAEVFAHTAGDPASYRSAAGKDALLARYTGLQSDQVDVGQGSGQTLVTITELAETSTGSAFEVEATLDLRATGGGVVGGFSIGGGVDVDLSITRGTETIYQGSVGNLPAEHFPVEAYRLGLFAYVFDDPAATPQTFEVIDYWVEPL